MQSDLSFELSVYRALLRQLEPVHRNVPRIVGLALLAFLLEGASLYLFLPLLNLFTSPGNMSALPGFMRDAIERFPASFQIPTLVTLVVIGVGLKNALSYWNGVQFARNEVDIVHRIRSVLYSAILKANPNHVDAEPSGRIANALLSETWRVSRSLQALYAIITDLCAIAVFLSVLLFLSWQWTLFILPFVAAIGVVLYGFTRAARRFGAGAVAASTDYTSRAWEGLAGIRTVRVFGAGGHEEERLNRASLNIRRHVFDAQRMATMIPALFETLAIAAIGVWVVTLASTGATIAGLAVFFVVLYRMQPRIRSLVSARATLLELGNSIIEIEAVRKECEESRLPDGLLPFQGMVTGIQFEGVSATYRGQNSPTIANLDFDIPRNQTTAIVGPSGAGKSTVVNLICRMLDPDEGRLLIDGRDLRDYRLDDWYRRLGIVSQDIFLFDAPIAENIAYGSGGASRDAIIAAAKRAGAHDFILQQPDGYDTPIGDRGVRLSGGQRQRLAFARALVRQPDVLIMDEATNSLDSHSEEVIQNALEDLRQQVTIVMVAHRLATVRTADQIIVMNDGKVVERGTYSSLMRAGGTFSAMARLQSLVLEPEEEAGQATMQGLVT